MKHTRPLAEVIAELQALENANPGILCIVNDNEYGANVPKVKVAPVYVNEHEQVIILDDFAIENNEQTVKEYSEKTAKEMWESFGDDNYIWESFEEFEKSYHMVKTSNEEEMKWIKTAVPVVVIEN